MFIVVRWAHLEWILGVKIPAFIDNPLARLIRKLFPTESSKKMSWYKVTGFNLLSTRIHLANHLWKILAEIRPPLICTSYLPWTLQVVLLFAKKGHQLPFSPRGNCTANRSTKAGSKTSVSFVVATAVRKGVSYEGLVAGRHRLKTSTSKGSRIQRRGWWNSVFLE